VFSECHHFIKIQYSNERAAVLKQRQVLDKIKKSFFLKMRFIMQLIFLILCFSGVRVFSVFHEFSRSPYLKSRKVTQKQRQVLEKLKKVTFSQNKIYHATTFSDIVIFKCPSVLRIVLLKQKSMF